MFARLEYRQCVQNDIDDRRGGYFKGDLTRGHDALLNQAGALPNSQPPTPDKAVPVILLCRGSDPISPAVDLEHLLMAANRHWALAFPSPETFGSRDVLDTAQRRTLL